MIKSEKKDNIILKNAFMVVIFCVQYTAFKYNIFCLLKVKYMIKRL